MKKPFNLEVPKIVASQVADESFKVYCKEAKDGPAELLIFDEIGYDDWSGTGIAAKDVWAFVNNSRGSEINVKINSPGGLVYDGMQIYNALISHDETVTVEVVGLAFSAASLIAMAGDTIRMHEASDLGIHRAWGVSVGNQKAMRATADWLNTIDGHLIDAYQDKSGQSRDKIVEMIDGEDDGTLMSAEEAVALGFADEIIPKKNKKKDKACQQRLVRASHQARLARIRERHASS